MFPIKLGLFRFFLFIYLRVLFLKLALNYFYRKYKIAFNFYINIGFILGVGIKRGLKIIFLPFAFKIEY